MAKKVNVRKSGDLYCVYIGRKLARYEDWGDLRYGYRNIILCSQTKKEAEEYATKVRKRMKLKDVV